LPRPCARNGLRLLRHVVSGEGGRRGHIRQRHFGFSLLFVFLILAALYESWSLPFSILLTVPIAVFGAFTGVWMRAYAFDVYAKSVLIVLIGLAAKNAF